MRSTAELTAPAVGSPFGVGHTPLLQFHHLCADLKGIAIYAKAEWLNPSGSVKDRPAARIISAALNSGALKPGKTILDASSGNTGIAFARIGALLGYPVKLAVPASINSSRKGVLLAYGTDLILTDPLENSDGAIREAQRIYKEDPDAYFYGDQYNNPENWRAHYETTGPEILAQTEGAVTHFVAGLGTTGTFRGTGTRLKEEKPEVRLISVQPDSPLHGLEGLKHMESALVPGIYDPRQADQKLFIKTEEAQKMVLRIAKEEGILVGPSGGANLAAARKIGKQLSAHGRKAVIVTILPDSGERYLEERFWKNNL